MNILETDGEALLRAVRTLLAEKHIVTDAEVADLRRASGLIERTLDYLSR